MDHPLGAPWTTHVKKTPQSDFETFKAEISQEYRDLRTQYKTDAAKHEKALSETLQQILKCVHDAQASETSRVQVENAMLQHMRRVESDSDDVAQQQGVAGVYLRMLQDDSDAVWRFTERRLLTLEAKAGITYVSPRGTPRECFYRRQQLP